MNACSGVKRPISLFTTTSIKQVGLCYVYAFWVSVERKVGIFRKFLVALYYIPYTLPMSECHRRFQSLKIVKDAKEVIC